MNVHNSLLFKFINIIIIRCCLGQTVEILASSNACFSSVDYTQDTFSAPNNGKIIGIKLIYNNGGVTCSTDAGLVNWGCSGRGFTVELLHVIDSKEYIGETYYPKQSTTV